MRLINVDTLELEEFFDDDIPKYAILSHTWGHEEVSFQDLCWLHEYEHNRTVYASIVALVSQIGQNMANKAAAIRQRAGFDKIVQSARLAKSKHMLRYVWVDTCCIDKSSSAELSEAINSMFRWYQRSDICIAFLSDVCEDLDDCCLEDSRWFTRGWTLQELLAPSKVVFYDLQWNELCTRDSWAPRIEDITGIPWSALVSQRGLNIWSLAERMSWASKRTTSRKEDMAYCLMGLFEINMPLLYGEGGKAFIRLQQEIIKEHRDQSLFAWGHNESMLTVRSIFAPSPSLMGSVKMAENTFTHMDTCHLSNKHLENTFASMDAFHLSNKYLEISLNILQVPNTGLHITYAFHSFRSFQLLIMKMIREKVCIW
ncbi:het domain-containing protein [Colletotrichum camelliae]|nr:het domain-containing protein [Colletotrichum camelliae]